MRLCCVVVWCGGVAVGGGWRWVEVGGGGWRCGGGEGRGEGGRGMCV